MQIKRISIVNNNYADAANNKIEVNDYYSESHEYLENAHDFFVIFYGE